MEEKNKRIKSEKVVLIGWLLFLIWWVVNSIINNCGVYADGSYSFAEVLRAEDFWLWYPARKTPMFLTRLFLVAFIKCGVTNAWVLLKMYSFGCVFWTALFVGVASYVFYKNDIRLFELNICVWGLIIVYTGLYCMHESLLTTAIVWLEFSIICLYDKLSSTKLKIIGIVVAILGMLGTHENYAVLGITLLILWLVKWFKQKRKTDILFYIYLLAILVGILYEVYAIIISNDTSRAGFIQSTLYVDRPTIILFVLLMVYVLVFSIVEYSVKLEKARRFIEVLLSVGIVVFMLKDTNTIVHDTRYIRSLLHIVIPGGMIIVTAFTMAVTKKKFDNMASFISRAIIISSCATVTLVGYGYSSYLRGVYEATEQRIGFVEWKCDDKLEVYNTDWTIPFESIIATKIYGSGNDSVQSIAVQPMTDIYYQPFDMWNIDAYYDLSKYGIIYEKDNFSNVVAVADAINFNLHADDSQIVIDRGEDCVLNVTFELDSDAEVTYLNQGIFNLSYHIYDVNGNLILWDGSRTYIEKYYHGMDTSVRIDEIATMDTARYVVVIDAVQEGVCWMSDNTDELPRFEIEIR